MSTFEQSLTQSIHAAIDRRIREIAEEELAAVQQNIARRVRAELARLVLSVQQNYSVQMMEREIVIRIQNGLQVEE